MRIIHSALSYISLGRMTTVLMKTQFISVVLLVISAAVMTCAQTETAGRNELSVWGGFSPDSTIAIQALGRTPDARFGILGLRYARRFNISNTFNLKYTADIVPAAILNYPDIEVLPAIPPSIRNVRPTRYAFGAAPVGLQINFRPRKKIQPFAGASGGFLYFAKRVPNIVGTRFNFTFDIGAGVEFRLREKRAVTIGYKYYHISNAGRGIENAGIDNNLLYVGYTFFSN